LAVVEATVRLLPGALGDEGSAEADSFADGLLDHPHYPRPAARAGPAAARSFPAGLLDHPHYPRPADVRGRGVPEVLLSGDHGRIRRWRRKESLRATRARRPERLARAALWRG